MTRYDEKKETCPCQVCRSDLAYIALCDYEDAIDFEIVYTPEDVEQLSTFSLE